ncbi:pectate lyase [Paraflavisolibacter sp. H34]|uniref:pectate lyase family protein n=1 Tax=Huijunlia imazamoxiresistens TaxID=3127457 RepID=UPI003017535B
MKKLMLLCLLVGARCLPVWSQTPAFPGAEGGGMYTTGGRGGPVYYITRLDDKSEGNPATREGSLRWCLEQAGKRIILFKVSGTIWLDRPLRIHNGDVTIAGQSAPGDGICLAGHPVSVDADNVIVRYLRVRMGDARIDPREADGADAFSGRQHKNIVIDHCSISWSLDECSSFYDNENFTMQWCLISESLRLSGHSKGPHGYGAIWGGVNATFHHNLLAHHDSRTPRFGPGVKHAGHDTTDVRNNVFYNWNGNGCYGGEAMHISLVNNYYKPGPATGEMIAQRIVALNANAGTHGFERIKDVWGRYYVSGNLLPHNKKVSADNWLGVQLKDGKQAEEIKLLQPITVGKIHTQPAATAYEKVLQWVGCSRVRDAVDQRIIRETKTGTAPFKGLSKYNGEGGSWKSLQYPRPGILDSQSDLDPHTGGSWSAWPELKSAPAPADTNGDGIPDGWLERHYPGKKATDRNAEGYTYVEVYLNSLVAHITRQQR